MAKRRPPKCFHLPADARVITLELQAWNDGGQVRVAAPFTDAVERALHVYGTRVHRDQRVRYRTADVVVAVYADALIGEQAAHQPCDLIDFKRGHAAVGVTQAKNVCTAAYRCMQRLDGVRGIVRVPVEKMLGVVNDFLVMILKKPHRILHACEVAFKVRFENLGHVQIPTFAEDRYA